MGVARAWKWLVIPCLLLLARSSFGDELQVIDAKTVRTLEREARTQLRDAERVISRNAKRLGYSRADIASALEPSMIRKGTLEVKLADGTRVEMPWFRIGFAENRYANTGKAPHGPSGAAETNKGGVRIHKGVFESEVRALALKMDSKLAVTGDALGGYSVRGAKGGIGIGRVTHVGPRFAGRVHVGDFVDPASPAIDSKELVRAFARAYRKSGGQVGIGSDTQAGDVNTKQPQMMAMAREYARLDGKRIPSAGVSGKKVATTRSGDIDARGGIQYRSSSTGEGVWFSARHAASRVGLDVAGATVVSQGWGEVGRGFGMAAVRDGARVIAIEELWNVGGKKVAGTLVHPRGQRASLAEVRSWLASVDRLRASGQDLRSFEGGALLTGFRAGTGAHAVSADIVGINALGGTLNEKSVPGYLASGTTHGKTKIIAEGANLAETSAGARLIDRARGKLLAIPGDLANLGGVHISNLEAVQNASRRPISDEVARASLEKTISNAWRDAERIAAERGITMRAAIELLATDRMMKRSLHRPDATRHSLEREVLGRQRAPRSATTRLSRARTRKLIQRMKSQRRRSGLRRGRASARKAARPAKRAAARRPRLRARR